jgi:hypothetical protein
VAPSSGSTEFDTTLKALLGTDSAKKVSEEDLFAALVSERIKKAKGEEQGTKFQETLEAKKNEMRKGDGYIPMEDAAKAALVEARESGILSKEEADKIYSEAFAAAQLDANTGVLFDGRGGPNDTTVAVASLEEALAGSRGILEKFDSGAEKAPERSVDEASNGKALNMPGSPTAGDQGFLFKPTSESDGKLVVLLPSRLSGLIAGVQLFDPAGRILDSGRYTGNGNGGREHFRFSKAGSGYPDGTTVEVSLKTGDKLRYVIGDTSQRVENINPQTDSGATGSGGDTSSGGSSSSGQSQTQDSNNSL